jgi:hypothetical protein
VLLAGATSPGGVTAVSAWAASAVAAAISADDKPDLINDRRSMDASFQGSPGRKLSHVLLWQDCGKRRRCQITICMRAFTEAAAPCVTASAACRFGCAAHPGPRTPTPVATPQGTMMLWS